jgi:hypothetical protein
MFKIIVNTPRGVQELIKVESTGGYFEKARVVWDERIDGSLAPEHEAAIGGLVRENGALRIDDAMLATQQAAKAAQATQTAARKTRVENAHQFLRGLDLSGTLTAGQIQNAIKSLVIVERND